MSSKWGKWGVRFTPLRSSFTIVQAPAVRMPTGPESVSTLRNPHPEEQTQAQQGQDHHLGGALSDVSQIRLKQEKETQQRDKTGIQ